MVSFVGFRELTYRFNVRSSTVLVSDGQDANTRDAVVAVRALAAADYRVAATVAAPSKSAAISRYVDERVVMPPVDHSDFKSQMSELLDSSLFVALVPASESVMLALDPPGAELMSKTILEERAIQAGIEVIESRLFDSYESLLSAVDTLEFPLVVKPVVRSFKAIHFPDRSALEKADIEAVPLVVQPFVVGGMEVISGVMWQGEVHTAVHERWDRIWPRDCGLAAAATTIEVNEGMVEQLQELMEGYVGLFSAQFLAGKLIDLNLRVPSSLPLAVAAGANLAGIYVDLVRGQSPQRIRAVPGHRFRWLSGEFKGLIRDWKAGGVSIPGALEILKPHAGTAHSMFSIKDPLPFLLRAGEYV